MPLTTLVAGQTARASHMNSNFALAVLVDTARTITATHTWSGRQDFTGGANFSGGTVNFSGATVTNLSTTFPDGTVSLPSFTFTNDTDCGLYRIGANNIGLALNGAKVVDFLTTGITVTGTTTSTAFAGPLTGNASTATALATSRTIWGQSFDGTGNVSGALSGATTGVFSGNVSMAGLTASSGLFSAVGSGVTELLRVRTTDTGDVHPAFYLQGNRGGVSHVASIRLDNGTGAGTELGFWVDDSGGTLTKRLSISNAGALIGGTYNGQTISSAANFTGTMTVGGVVTISHGTAQIATFTSTNAAGGYTLWSRSGTPVGYAGNSDQLFGDGALDDFEVRANASLYFTAQTNIFIRPDSTGTVNIGRAGAATLVAGALGVTGKINTDDTTQATSGTDGSLQTDGGLSVVKQSWLGGTVLISNPARLGVRVNLFSNTDRIFAVSTASEPVTATQYAADIHNDATSSTASIDRITLNLRNTGTWSGGTTRAIGLSVESITTGTTSYAIYTNSGLVRFGDEVLCAASTTSRASLNLPHGSAPTSPVDGDVWTTTAGLFVRINGATVGPLS